MLQRPKDQPLVTVRILIHFFFSIELFTCFLRLVFLECDSFLGLKSKAQKKVEIWKKNMQEILHLDLVKLKFFLIYENGFEPGGFTKGERLILWASPFQSEAPELHLEPRHTPGRSF